MEFAGAGGMGAVYRATNLTTGETVAVKILQPHIVARSPECAELFEREAKNAEGLDHPHIVKVFDTGKDEDLSYMVMEWVEGRSVEDVLTQGQLPLDRLTNVFEQICSAVVFAHERNIIHLDLKPGNILLLDRLEPNDFVKVIDFGLSRVISKESGTTVTKFRGTHQFCAPEQFGGKVSYRSDIYSLGATLYYLLTGVIPFGTSYINAKIHPHLELPEIPSVVRQRNLPPGLDPVIRKALNKNPASRQQSALQLFDEFHNAIRRTDPADTTDHLFIKLQGILVDELAVDEREVVPTASIVDDLGADDADVFDIITKLEKEFSIDIPDEEAETLVTVNDVYNYLKYMFTTAVDEKTFRPEHYYEFGNFRLYPDARLLLRDDRPIPLTYTEFRVLLLLVRNSGRLVTHGQFLNEAWQGVTVEYTVISKYISNLRLKLGERPPERQFIETVRNEGYRFSALVTEHSPERL